LAHSVWEDERTRISRAALPVQPQEFSEPRTYRDGPLTRLRLRRPEFATVKGAPNVDRLPVEVDVRPAQCKQFRSAPSGRRWQNRHGAVAFWQREQQLAHLLGFVRDPGQDAPLRRQPDTQGWVVVHVSPLPSDTEDLAERSPDMPEDTR